MSDLQGNATGATRAELITKATKTAVTYYGTECVAIVLQDEECDAQEFNDGAGNVLRTGTTFRATWTAAERHLMIPQARGADPSCKECGMVI